MSIKGFVAITSVALWWLQQVSNVCASSENNSYSSPSHYRQKKNSKRKVKRNVPENHGQILRRQVAFSDFDPIDIVDNEEEERLLALLERIDTEKEQIPTKQTKSKKSRRKTIKRNETKGPLPDSNIEETQGLIQPDSVEALQDHIKEFDSSLLVPDDEKLLSVQNTNEVADTAPSITASFMNGHIERNQATSIHNIPFDGSQITHTASLPAVTADTAVAIAPLNPKNNIPLPAGSLPYATQSSMGTKHLQHRLAQKTKQLQTRRMLEQRASMLSYTTPWVIDFLQSRPKDALLAVPRDFLGDGFNLVHLAPVVERLAGSNDMSFPIYKAALRVILSADEHSDVPSQIQSAAETLYAMIHGRYVTSPRGLDTLCRILMHDKETFGKCPRPSCRGMPMLPHGESSPGRNSSRYCCSCGQVWECWDSKVDGIAWGSSLCHLYLLTYGTGPLGNVRSTSAMNPTAVIPTIFGFQVHSAALRSLHHH